MDEYNNNSNSKNKLKRLIIMAPSRKTTCGYAKSPVEISQTQNENEIINNKCNFKKKNTTEIRGLVSKEENKKQHILAIRDKNLDSKNKENIDYKKFLKSNDNRRKYNKSKK